MQLTLAKAEDIVYTFIEGMPLSSRWDAVKKRLGQVFGPVAKKNACKSIQDPSLPMRLYRDISSNSPIC